MSGTPRRITVKPPVLRPVVPYQCDTGRPVCGQKARLYPAGWRCDQHRPSNPNTTNTTN